MCEVCIHVDLCMIMPAARWRGCPCWEAADGLPPVVVFDPTPEQVAALGGAPPTGVQCSHEDIVGSWSMAVA
jgi:hypothetical protein